MRSFIYMNRWEVNSPVSNQSFFFSFVTFSRLNKILNKFYSKFQIFLPKPRTRKQYTDKMRATRSSSDQGSTHRLVIISVGAGWCNIFRIAAWIPGSEMKCGSWWKFSQPNITGGAILKTVKAISWLQPNLLFELTGIKKKTLSVQMISSFGEK